MAVFHKYVQRSKSALYVPCIAPPRTLNSLFAVASIIRSPCFVENLSTVRLLPTPLFLRFFQIVVFDIRWTSNIACWYLRQRL